MVKVTLTTRKDRKLSQGYPIILYVRLQDKKLRFYTDLYVRDPSLLLSDKVSKKDKLWNEKNSKLTEILSKVNIILLKDSNVSTIKDNINEILNHKVSRKEKLLIDYLEEFLKTRSGKRTQESYWNTVRKIKGFDPKASIENIDALWLSKFTKHCSSTMSVNGYFGHLKNLRAVFNYLVNEGITTNYPFRTFKIKTEATLHRALTIEQVRAIATNKNPEFMEKYRDVFMLMVYLIGINSKDLLYLKEDNLIDGRMYYHRYKTNRLYSIKIEPEALCIINRYKGKSYLLNFMDSYSNHLTCLHHINDNLKKIGMEYVVGVGYSGKPICPELTTYYARHTWASLAFELGIPKDTISLALGHSTGVKVTDIYIKYDLQKIDEANRKVIDYIHNVKIDWQNVKTNL